jgi:RsiW-degrading membrane proteinase PrsW (M82 family)
MEKPPRKPRKDYMFVAFMCGLGVGAFFGNCEVLWFHFFGDWGHSEFGCEVIAVTALAGGLIGLYVTIVFRLLRFVLHFMNRDLNGGDTPENPSGI